MNRDEARPLLEHELDSLERLGYATLARRVDEVVVFEATAESGRAYEIEISFFWDHRPGGALRVIGAISDGDLSSAIAPLCSDRLIDPI